MQKLSYAAIWSRMQHVSEMRVGSTARYGSRPTKILSKTNKISGGILPPLLQCQARLLPSLDGSDALGGLRFQLCMLAYIGNQVFNRYDQQTVLFSKDFEVG